MPIDSAALLERFLRYVRIDTRSDPHSPSQPSTPGQWDMLHLLEQELKIIGATEVTLLPAGYVLATIPATSPKANVPTIAWFAHVDTAPNLLPHRLKDGSLDPLQGVANHIAPLH